jgi:hypothetical protein
MNDYYIIKTDHLLKIKELLDLIVEESAANNYIVIEERIYNSLLSKIHELSYNNEGSNNNNSDFLSF